MRGAVAFAGLAVLAAVVVVVITMTGGPSSSGASASQAEPSEAQAGPVTPKPAAKAERLPSGDCPPKPPPPGTSPPWFQGEMIKAALKSLMPGCRKAVFAAVREGGELHWTARAKPRDGLPEEVSALRIAHRSCLAAAGRADACASLAGDQRTTCERRALLYGKLLPASAARKACPPGLVEDCARIGAGAEACRAACEALGGKGEAACAAAGKYQSLCRAVATHTPDVCPAGDAGAACRGVAEEIAGLKKGQPGKDARWPFAGASQGAAACDNLLEAAVAELCSDQSHFEIETPKPQGAKAP